MDMVNYLGCPFVPRILRRKSEEDGLNDDWEVLLLVYFSRMH